MAKIQVDVIADASSLRSALGEIKSFESTSTSAFGSAAKSVLGYATAFVGVGGLVEAIGKSVSAGEDLNRATRTLDAQLRANGESVQAISPYIETLNSNMEKLGFTNTETEQAFTRLDRASGSAAVAYQAMGVAADLAAAKHISLQQAALLVGKVIDGNTSALNRYGIAVPKGATATEALAIAQQKLAGQAAASVSPMDEFRAIITDLEAKIGQALLPTIDKYLEKANEWLSNSENQQRVINDVKTAVRDFTTAINDASSAVQAIYPYVKDVIDKLGGFKQTLELIIGLKFASWASGLVGDLTQIGVSAGEKGAAGKVGLLSTRLQALKTFGTIAVTIAVGFEVAKGAQAFSKWLGGTSFGKTLGLGDTPLQNGLSFGDLAKIASGNGAGGVLPGSFPGIGNTSGVLGGYVNPVPGGSFARVDQGTDYVAKSNVVALGAGTIVSVTKGMAGGTGDIIKEALVKPITVNGHTYYGVYYSEENPLVKAGQSVSAGQAVMGPGGNELGFLDKSGHMAPLIGGLGAGTQPTQAGADFNAFVKTLGGVGGTSDTHGSLPPGTTNLPDTHHTKPAAFKIPDALEAEIRKAQDVFKNDVTQQHLDTLTGLLTQEENLLKEHHQLAKSASVANEITDAEKKLADEITAAHRKLAETLDKVAIADVQAAGADATKAEAAFAKGQIGPAESYTKAEVKSLTEAKAQLEKAIAAAPAADKAGYEKQLASVEAQLKGLQGATDWIASVGQIFSSFGAKLKTEGTAYQGLLNQRTAQSELQAVGYFKDTADAMTSTDEAIVTSLQGQASTLKGEIDALKAKLATAPAGLKAGLESQIAALTGQFTTLTSSITSAMGTVEQDLAGAVQQAQGKFQSAANQLMSDLDTQLATNIYAATGYTSDSQQLQLMQQQDQQTSLNDALASATKTLAADMKEGSGATQDQIDADNKAVTAAQRAIDENNLSIKVQAEYADAQKQIADQTKALNGKLGDLITAVESGSASFDGPGGLADVLGQFGLTIDNTVTPGIVADFGAASSAASTLVGAFGALIAWINKQTGSNIAVPTAATSTGLPVGAGGPANQNPACFVAGTLVSTSDGWKPIERIEVGDTVRTWDFADGFVDAPVVETQAHEGDDRREVLLVEADHRFVRVTAEHPFWTGEAWKPAGELQPGDQVAVGTARKIKQVTVTNVAKLDGVQDVYNLHVDHPDHNYLAETFLVHNMKQNVAQFASGGLVTQPTFAIVGEAGPELILPLSKLGKVSGGGTLEQHFHFDNYVGDKRELIQTIKTELQREVARNR